MGVIFIQEKTREQSLEIMNIKKEALTYAGEVFLEHRERIFAALQFLCQCSYIVQQYGFLILDAIIGSWDEDTLWEEDVLLAISMADRDMPLKELLLCMVQKLADVYTWNETEKEILEWAKANGCFGHEWYVVYLYLAAGENIRRGVSPEQFLLMARVMVPEQWLEDYDRYCKEWTQMRQEEQQEEKWERINEEFEEEISITTAFNRIFEEMGTEKMRFIMKEVDHKTLAAGIAFAKEPVRKRFLENMPAWQRNLVAGEWSYMRRYGYHWEDNFWAMDRMLMVAGLTGEA